MGGKNFLHDGCYLRHCGNTRVRRGSSKMASKPRRSCHRRAEVFLKTCHHARRGRDAGSGTPNTPASAGCRPDRAGVLPRSWKVALCRFQWAGCGGLEREGRRHRDRGDDAWSCSSRRTTRAQLVGRAPGSVHPFWKAPPIPGWRRTPERRLCRNTTRPSPSTAGLAGWRTTG